MVDSAGFTAEELSPDQLIHEIRVLIQLADPGPHVFVFVVKMGRLSRGDSHLLRLLSSLCDGELSEHSMVFFTHGDALRDQSLHQKIQSSSCVSDLVSGCVGRYCVFDNTQTGNRIQVRKFMKLIDEIIRDNEGRHFSSDTFNTTENFDGEDTKLRTTLWNRLQISVCGCFCPQSSCNTRQYQEVL